MAVSDRSPLRLVTRLFGWLRRRDSIAPGDRERGVRSVRDDPGPDRIDDARFPSL